MRIPASQNSISSGRFGACSTSLRSVRHNAEKLITQIITLSKEKQDSVGNTSGKLLLDQ